MTGFLNEQQRIDLRQAHRRESRPRFADRIKAILALDSGWSIPQISEMLLIDPETIRRWHSPATQFNACLWLVAER